MMINSASFVANVVRITSGSVFGQLILVISSPLITRIYDPEIFGTFAIYNAIVRLISAISPLRYEMAVVIAQKSRDAKHLALIALSFVFITVFLVYQIPTLVKYFNYFSDSTELINTYPLIICTSILIWGIINILMSIETRYSYFSNVAVFKFIKPVTTSLFHILYGLLVKSTAIGLFVGDIFGSLLGLIYLGVKMFKRYSTETIRDLKLSRTLYLLKRYKNFPLFGTWTVLVNSLMLQVPVLILSNYYSANVIGYFALSNRLLQMPMALFNSGVSQVFLKNASENKSSLNISVLVLKTLSRLIMIGAFPCILIAIIGQDLFTLMFGSQWSEAGQYTQILSLWWFSAFLIQPLSHLVNVLEKQKQGLIINLARLIIRLGTLVYSAILFNDIFVTLILYSIAGFISNILYLFWLLKLSKCSIISALNSFLKYVFLSLVFSLPLIISIKVMGLTAIGKIAFSFLLFVLYILFIFYTDKGLRLLFYNSTKYGKKL